MQVTENITDSNIKNKDLRAAAQSTDLNQHNDKLLGRYEDKEKYFIRADNVASAGYETKSTPPEPIQCEFCGRLRHYYGYILPGQKIIFQWSNEPEVCDCKRAQEQERKRREDIETEEKRKTANAKIQRITDKSGMRARFLTRTFERFSVTEENVRAYTAAKHYVDRFDAMLPKKDKDGKYCPPEVGCNGLFITGSYGTGKTHLAAAIANELMNRGTACICMTMIDLLQKIKSSFESKDAFGAGVVSTEESIMRTYECIPLLIIDDIGSEQPTEWGISKIYAIINARYEAYMPVIITTNYGGAELIQRMTPRGADSKNAEKTLDRLKEMCAGIELNGESWRTKDI